MKAVIQRHVASSKARKLVPKRFASHAGSAPRGYSIAIGPAWLHSAFAKMKHLGSVGVLLVALTVSGAEVSGTNGTAADPMLRLYEQIYEQLTNEKGAITNEEMMKMPIAREAIVYKAFGGVWNSVSAPTITAPEALASVQAFVATNGWNMQTGGLLFTYGLDKPKPRFTTLNFLGSRTTEFST
jgi:hypothetical protein